MARKQKLTLAHVTHEAVEKIGGIGTVLEGMMSSPVYRAAVQRSILVGPMGGHHYESPLRRLGDRAKVFYSSIDRVSTNDLDEKLRPIEEKYGVRIGYGSRQYVDEGSGRSGEAEVLLFDVSNPVKEPLDHFKWRLWNEFGIDAGRFESDWGFEEYCRLAEPAFAALSALLGPDDLPCVIFSHEFMGMCTALKAVLDGGRDYRTVFHAHECATARHIVENHQGHDTAFYNILTIASQREHSVEDVFGDMSGIMRHALISRAHRLDAVAAVGDPTAAEMRFLNRAINESDRVEIVYNGIPELPTDAASKEHSREMMLDWCESTMNFRPDFILTHVTRPVISKGLWRDIRVCEFLDDMLAKRGERALFLLLTCGAPPRSAEHVREMANAYNWPIEHREGYPDLVGPETGTWRNMMAGFNREHANVRTVLVNQFGWSRDLIGPSVPADMNFTDLRRAADVEFGQSVYEPFGIAQFEPFAGGAICVPSSVCGCVTSWHHVLKRLGVTPDDCPNVIVADYTQLDGDVVRNEEALLNMTERERSAVEERVAREVAHQLMERLPRSPEERDRLIASANRIAHHMSWDSVIEHEMLPLLDRVASRSR